MAAWRQMLVTDMVGLQRVAEKVHPDLQETDEVTKERLALFPEGCLVLTDGDEICGYAISHPIRHGQPPALNTLLGEIPPDADQYFIHDVAILPRFRGHGLAKPCIGRLLAVAERYPTTCLISVYGTPPFWAHFGFVAAEPVDGGSSDLVRGYGEDAKLLLRRNSPEAGGRP